MSAIYTEKRYYCMQIKWISCLNLNNSFKKFNVLMTKHYVIKGRCHLSFRKIIRFFIDKVRSPRIKLSIYMYIT